MLAIPPPFDVWLIAHLAMLWGRSPTFDFGVQQSVAYGVLGGLWYASVLFLFWVQGAQPGQREVRRCTLTIAFGSLVAALLTVIVARAVSWAPPSAHPELAGLYPAGVYLLKRDLLQTVPMGREVSLEREIFPAWIQRRLYGYQNTGRFLDIGTPESYREAESFFAVPNLLGNRAERPNTVVKSKG